MINLYKKIFSLFSEKEKKKFILLLILMVLMSLLEVIGVGSIMPFLSVLGNPEVVETNKYLHAVYLYFDFERKNSFLIFLGIFALSMLLVGAIVKSITSYAKFRFANIRRHSLGKKLLRRYLNQPYDFFLSRNSSDISKVILSETDLTIQQAILPVLNFLTYFILTVFLIGFLIVIDPILALILGGIFGGFYILMYMTIRKYLSKIGEKRNRANTQRFKITSETIGGIKDLKVLGREKIYLESFDKPSYEFSHYTSINQTLAEIPLFLVEVVAFGSLLAMAMYILTTDGENIGSLLPVLGLYALGAVKLKPAVNYIYKSLATMKFGVSAVNNIFNDLKMPYKNIYLKNNDERLIFKSNLRLDDITFTYPNVSKPALKNINIHIKANTTVGIIGTTGSGKSTLVDIILGLLYPSNGKIKIDEQFLNKDNIRSWQNVIGYVPQNIFLSDDSIANNIAFGIEKKNIDMDQVHKVAKMAQADSFILSLEQGFDTIIGERGIRLSGGQRQRLGIARALYHNPDLLVLDEATSALDNNTEKEVMEAINSMNGEKTIIMIAHRLSTIEKCDQIIKLENGEII